MTAQCVLYFSCQVEMDIDKVQLGSELHNNQCCLVLAISPYGRYDSCFSLCLGIKIKHILQVIYDFFFL